MIRPRLIPVLLIDQRKLIKTFQFKDEIYLGDPMNTVRIFNEKYADELSIIDRSAWKKSIDFDFLGSLASEAFMPLSYGGGIKSLADAEKLFRSGFEKLILCSMLFESPSTIREIAKCFGSQSVVVQINVKKSFFGSLMVYDHRNGKNVKALDENFIKSILDLEIGELILNFVDRDGSANGIDTKVIESFSKICSVPLIASGGIGNLDQIKEAFKAGASAIAGSRFFCLQGPHKAPLIKYPNDKEILSLVNREVI